MSNWIDDGHGNKWHRCKLGADCGLKVIEAGKARCWCQDQEASRCEMQVAREQIRCLEADNERLRETVRATFKPPPPNQITFHPSENGEVLVLRTDGFHYRGRVIEDAGEAHQLFLEFFKRARKESQP